MNANLLQHQYYLEARIPTAMKFHKLRRQNYYQKKKVETPEPLKVEKFKLFPTPFSRTKSSNKKARKVPSELKEISDSKLFNESFNNFLATHALTALSPVELINHYRLDTPVKTPKKVIPKLPEMELVQINLKKVYESSEISISDIGKVEEELFQMCKKIRKPHIATINDHNSIDFKIVGNMLSLPNRRQINSRDQHRQIPIKFKSHKVADVRLKSPDIQINSTDTLIGIINPLKEI
ncbi:hypothetical protein SteCoe_21635 [Stentor coeruleus]|uniref:Uncharacterized protein n=1 Tax=Stentor coeruleus TaxID=5963 RepID=A0A1R2BP94_9CILI|nr:hypothetical protein SteCoe_21635 [Stentor coeruleus]